MKLFKYHQYLHHLKADWFLEKPRKVKIVSGAAIGQKLALSDRSDSKNRGVSNVPPAHPHACLLALLACSLIPPIMLASHALSLRLLARSPNRLLAYSLARLLTCLIKERGRERVRTHLNTFYTDIYNTQFDPFSHLYKRVRLSVHLSI